MKLSFSKYQGTGNDFIMLNNLNGYYDHLSIEQIRKICNRRFGIGADGLIKINSHDIFDFEMDYYNSDGSKSFCGNGARCAVSFAETLGIDVRKTTFLGIDGVHKASKENGIISLEMGDVLNVCVKKNDYVINTGSPHYIHFAADSSLIDVVEFGKEIRYSTEFIDEGINVNVVEIISANELIVNTYERGVEDETLSCGTGVTACVLAFAYQNDIMNDNVIKVKVKGGDLKVSFLQQNRGIFTNIQLIGPGEFVYSGEINV